jgi:hypothetical protein
MHVAYAGRQAPSYGNLRRKVAGVLIQGRGRYKYPSLAAH